MVKHHNLAQCSPYALAVRILLALRLHCWSMHTLCRIQKPRYVRCLWGRWCTCSVSIRSVAACWHAACSLQTSVDASHMHVAALACMLCLYSTCVSVNCTTGLRRTCWLRFLQLVFLPHIDLLLAEPLAILRDSTVSQRAMQSNCMSLCCDATSLCRYQCSATCAACCLQHNCCVTRQFAVQLASAQQLQAAETLCSTDVSIQIPCSLTERTAKSGNSIMWSDQNVYAVLPGPEDWSVAAAPQL